MKSKRTTKKQSLEHSLSPSPLKTPGSAGIPAGDLSNPIPQPTAEPASSSPNDPPPKPKPSFRLPPELEQLTPEELDYVNDQLRCKTYAEVQEMLLTKCGIHISINKLFRYYQKLELADQLDIAEDSTEAIAQLLSLYNGQSVDLDKAGLETIKRRALALAVSPSTKPSLLLNLVRIFTWEHRKSMDNLRKKVIADNAAHRDRMAHLAERRVKCEEDRVKILERHRTWLEKPRPQWSPEDQIRQDEILRKIVGPLYQEHPSPTPLPSNQPPNAP